MLPILALAVGGISGFAQNEDQSAPTAKQLEEMALRIDKQVAAFYRAKKMPVPENADDSIFLRRAFLVTVGRIPAVEESLPFLEIDDPDKRRMLVRYLLDSPGYASHMTNWAFDLLRITDRGADRNTPMGPYRDWVSRAIRENMRWDDFTRKLLSSSGDGWNPETAAVGYYTRDRGMPLDNLSNTMRIFLGERMECAQCHDDPYGSTERHDFYELAAFTHGQYSLPKKHFQPIWNEWQGEEKRRTLEYRVGRMLQQKVFNASLGGGGRGRIQLPDDYQYRDGQPGEWVAARTPFGKRVRMSDRKNHNDGRENLAEWVISRTDNRFAGVIANRMWKRIMGRGLYEPADEYKDPEDTHHLELAKLLESLMIELDYDLLAFQNVLLLTRTFQFATNPDPSKVEGGDDFHGRKIDRLSAEQIWDSLVTLARGNPDDMPYGTVDTTVRLDGKAVLVGKKTMDQLSKEVLAIDDEREMRRYFKELVEEIRNSKNSKGDPSMAMMSAGNRRKGGLIRASELPSPTKRTHLLYLFGASDRGVVEAGSRDPNVSQVLSLMNGFVQDHLVNRSDAHLYKCLEGANTPQDQVRRLYLTILNRPPTSHELEWMSDEVKINGEAGICNIAAALVMCSEFVFLQ